eukprot:TRINITY_DN21837_c0_g1_i1.p1 TRINITY_DN21837_c0_g1~~TRINITY_DN21837_c0_g1_i1.p1  ORF type:complete len:278 (+),score=43.28 TRINITY_DN21837_c0_g1_i1:100-933(+)
MASAAAVSVDRCPNSGSGIEDDVQFDEVLHFVADILEEMDLVLTQNLVEMLLERASTADVLGLSGATWTKMRSHIESNCELRRQTWQHPVPKSFQLVTVPIGRGRSSGIGEESVKLGEVLHFLWKLLENMDLVLSQELVAILQEHVSSARLLGLRESSWTRMMDRINIMREDRRQMWQPPAPMSMIAMQAMLDTDYAYGKPRNIMQIKLSCKGDTQLKEEFKATTLGGVLARVTKGDARREIIRGQKVDSTRFYEKPRSTYTGSFRASRSDLVLVTC